MTYTCQVHTLHKIIHVLVGNQVVWEVSTRLEICFCPLSEPIIKIINCAADRGDYSGKWGQGQYLTGVPVWTRCCVVLLSWEGHITTKFKKMRVNASTVTSKMSYFLKCLGAYVACEWTFDGRH